MALLFPTLQFHDPAYTQYARPLALGKIYTYVTGTTTPKATYTDSAEGTQHANPIILNSNGQPEVSGLVKGIWLSSDGLYTIVIKNAAGTTLQTLDNVTGLGSTLTFFSTLSANLDTNGYSLVTTSGNQDITLQPNGTGKSKIYGLQPQDDVDMNGQDILMDSGSAIMDDSSNEYIKFAKTATAVNEITVTNQATGSNPQISATGGDTNIGLDFLSKGTGAYNFKGNASQAADLRLYEDTDNGTNYSTIRPAQSLANNSGILTLPTVAITMPTTLPVSTSVLLLDSSGNMATSGSGDITTTGAITGQNLVAAGSTAGPGELQLTEDADNGTSKITVKAAASLAADRTITLPALASVAGNTVIANDTSGTLVYCSPGEIFLARGSSAAVTGIDTLISNLGITAALLKVRIVAQLANSTDGTILLQYGYGATPTYSTADYSYHVMYSRNGSLNNSDSTSAAGISLTGIDAEAGAGAEGQVVADLLIQRTSSGIPNLCNTSGTSFLSSNAVAGTLTTCVIGGRDNSPADGNGITAIRLSTTAGSLGTYSIAVYALTQA